MALRTSRRKLNSICHTPFDKYIYRWVFLHLGTHSYHLSAFARNITFYHNACIDPHVTLISFSSLSLLTHSSKMRSFAALAACAALASAQTFDMDMILSAEPVPTPSIPVIYVEADAPTTTAFATTVSYIETEAVASVSSEVAAAAAAAAAASTTTLAKRDASTSCVAQPTGISHNSSPDTASAFLADVYYSSVASAAPTPAGYVNTFTNLQASNNAYGSFGARHPLLVAF